MKNQEAFTYCWTDHLKNMLYVGCHKGSEDDGYVCSSKWMLEEYTKRPDDFTRQIITEGTYDDCLMLEATILKTADAKNNSDYYNQHNGDGKFVCKNITEETREKLRRRVPWNKGKRMPEHQRQKLSKLVPWNKGKIFTHAQKSRMVPWNKGKTMNESQKSKLVCWNRGKHLSKDHKQKISESNKNPSQEIRNKISEANKRRHKTD